MEEKGGANFGLTLRRGWLQLNWSCTGTQRSQAELVMGLAQKMVGKINRQRA